MLRKNWLLLKRTKSFAPSTEMTKWLLSLPLFMCFIVSTKLHILKYPCIPAVKASTNMQHDLTTELLNLICKHFLEDFCAYIQQGILPLA